MSIAATLLCRVGRHRPRADPRWNRGYGFTTCARCGCDLVRSLVSDWRVPPAGQRVVWRDADPSAAGEPLAVRLARPPLPPGRSDRADNRSPFDFSDLDRDDPPRQPPSPLPRTRTSRS